MDMTLTLNKISSIGLACATLLLALLTGCNRTPTTVTLTPTSGVIAVGLSQQFTPTGYYGNGKILPLTGALWTISRPDVASVSPSGMVTGRTAGNAELVATINGLTIKAPITVTPLTVQSITLAPAPATIALGNTLSLSPTITYTDHRTVTLAEGAQAPGIDDHTQWRSDNESVATVDENGQVTVHQASGSATISLKIGAAIGQAVVTAAPGLVTKIFITASAHGLPNSDSGHLRLKRGSTLQLHAMGTGSNGITSELSNIQTETLPKASWLAEDGSIVAISPTGLVTAIGEGETRIVLTVGGLETVQGVMVE